VQLQVVSGCRLLPTRAFSPATLVIGSRGIKYQSFDPGAALIGYIYMEKSAKVSAIGMHSPLFEWCKNIIAGIISE